MSAQNVETVRRGYEAFNAGDLETALALFDPDLEVWLARDAETVWGLDFLEVYRGLDGFGQFLARLAEAWDEVRWVPEQFFDGGERVVVFIRMFARGRASGVEVDQRMAHVLDVRGDRLVRHETFFDRDAALAAAGLDPTAAQTPP